MTRIECLLGVDKVARCASIQVVVLLREVVDFALADPPMKPNRLDHETETSVRRFLSLISRRYDVAGAILYGSRARGTYRSDSDADVAVLLRGERQRVLPTTLAMADAAYDILLETGINISPLPVWTDEWEHPEMHRNPELLRNIVADGVRL